MPSSKFRKKQPRSERLLSCRCFADPVLFRQWEHMPQEARDEFKNNGPIPCEGGGVPGEWCAGCRFGRVESEDP